MASFSAKSSRAGSRATASGSRSGGQVRSPSGAKSSAAPRISDRLNPKTIDPFSTSRNKSAFANLYGNGAIPCRLIHGSVKHKLAWDIHPEQVQFDPVFIYLSQGLVETVHPYTFVARQGFKELVEAPESADKAIPLLSKVVPNIRAALSHKDVDVFEGALSSLLLLSHVVGPHINPHLKVLLVPIAKRGMEKKYRDRTFDALNELEQNGGKEALLLIKSKIPTYTSVVT